MNHAAINLLAIPETPVPFEVTATWLQFPVGQPLLPRSYYSSNRSGVDWHHSSLKSEDNLSEKQKNKLDKLKEASPLIKIMHELKENFTSPCTSAKFGIECSKQ